MYALGLYLVWYGVSVDQIRHVLLCHVELCNFMGRVLSCRCIFRVHIYRCLSASAVLSSRLSLTRCARPSAGKSGCLQCVTNLDVFSDSSCIPRALGRNFRHNIGVGGGGGGQDGPWEKNRDGSDKSADTHLEKEFVVMLALCTFNFVSCDRLGRVFPFLCRWWALIFLSFQLQKRANCAIWHLC